jgi:hypothetical protein
MLQDTDITSPLNQRSLTADAARMPVPQAGRELRAQVAQSRLRAHDANYTVGSVNIGLEEVERSNNRQRAEWQQVSVVPSQVWEGYVTSVIAEEHRFTADLNDVAGLKPSYSVEISMTEIDPEDLDLVVDGAVFYWTFGRVNLSKGNPANFDQIRFRRLPNWSKTRLAAVKKQADTFYDFFQAQQD